MVFLNLDVVIFSLLKLMYFWQGDKWQLERCLCLWLMEFQYENEVWVVLEIGQYDNIIFYLYYNYVNFSFVFVQIFDY